MAVYGTEVFELFVDMSESTEGVIEELVKLETEACFVCMDVQKTSFGLCLTGYSKVMVHRDVLKQYCRLCGNTATFAADRKPYNKETYQKTIKEALHLETDNEDPDIFPPFICKTCQRKLACFKLLKRQKKVFTVNIPLHDFKGHDDDTCIICTEEAIPNTEDVQRAGKQAAEEQWMSSSR
eukprot:XP_011675867.1 PREDICTED: uncharacterized protein LOC105443898 [Strongylocentrotus purpuratus]